MIIQPFDYLDSDSTIITPNQRLSVYLRKCYNQQQQHAGHVTWPNPDIISLTQWIARSYELLPTFALLLTPSQELVLWEEIIADSLTTHASDLLLSPTALAPSAQEAWHLMQQWQQSLSLLNQNYAEDIQLFYRWAKKFQSVCTKNSWIDSSSCTNELITRLASIATALPKKITLFGFTDVVPQLQQLFNELKKYLQLDFAKSNLTTPVNSQRVSLQQEDHELYTMALWAKEHYITDPTQRIGCVIPNLNSIRHKVERIFSEIFAEDFCSITNSYLYPYNISGGIRLNNYPLIYTALQILQFKSLANPIENISYLLRSPFIGGAESEMASRALLDVSLRQFGERQLDADTILTLSKKTTCLIWSNQLENYLSRLKNAKNYSLRAWAQYFMQQLNLLGWPGERSLNSTEYQQVQHWHVLMEEFARLETLLPEFVELPTALHYLQQLVERTLFQPQTPDVPIQILGSLEALGLPFDNLWVMGMNDDNWPQTPTPNPFIPLPLQRQLNIPHASAEREFAYCQRLTNEFCENSQQIFFSYSLYKKDIPLRMSALIQEFSEIVLDFKIPEFYSSDNNTLFENFEIFDDDIAPPVNNSETIRGGAAILKNQAACPFRAFASNRLDARKFPTLSSGLTPQERGTYVHEIMAEIWQVIISQQQLINFELEELHELVKISIKKIVQKKIPQRPLLANPRFREIETQRLHYLITQWLEIEKNRPPFQVRRQEFNCRIVIAGLELNLRVDREDELMDGSRFIIDYKTGNCDINDWFGERPNEPQLPLYHLIDDAPIHGLLFAQIRAGDSTFKGISANNYHIPGVLTIAEQTKDTSLKQWDDFSNQQQKTLTQLAQNFMQGHAQVDPKQAEKTCQYCDLQSLCRVKPS